MVTLQSKIIICKGIHLDKEHINVLNYTENQMLSLCESKAVATANDYSFIRNRGTIQTGFSYSQALQCNYLAFQNKDYDNKWFFAFIDDVQYIGENNTEISYTIDSFATWFPSITVGNCYVVREHVNDDTIGANLVPENVDLGSAYVVELENTIDLSNMKAGFIVSPEADEPIARLGNWTNGIFSALEFDRGYDSGDEPRCRYYTRYESTY